MRALRNVLLVMCISSFLLAGCDGNSQPFEEAVEVRNLQITALSVTPPANSQPTIFLNTNDRMQFGIQGLSANGTNLVLSGTGRRWSVSDSSIAGIDANGLLTAHANGNVSVFVSVGDLVSSPFTLTVSNATLTAIESIEGETSIERCLPQNYLALGRFSDLSLRNLNTVTWSIDDTVNARIVTNPDATVTLTGLNSGAPLSLRAAVGAIVATPASVTILDTLSELSISPRLARVDVDESQAFTATGTYNDQPATETMAAIGTRIIVISESVDWRITSGESNATVSNVSPTKVVLTGVASGNAVLSVSCGDLAKVQTVYIGATDSDDSDQLSFNTDDPLVILRSDTAGFRLRVSTGSSFSSANEVTEVDDNVIWNVSHSNSSTPTITLVETGVNAGLVRPLAFGTLEATVTATYNNQTISIRISVDPT